MSKAQSNFAWGALQGRVELSSVALAGATELARRHYAQAEAEEFSGDAVEDFLLPTWMANRAAWLPIEALTGLGFEPRTDAPEQLLATVGVDSHVDAIHGPVLIVALHNDGLTFKQGRHSHRTAVGEWFIFDDSKPHQVRESAKSTSYLCWAVPLRALQS